MQETHVKVRVHSEVSSMDQCTEQLPWPAKGLLSKQSTRTFYSSYAFKIIITQLKGTANGRSNERMINLYTNLKVVDNDQYYVIPPKCQVAANYNHHPISSKKKKKRSKNSTMYTQNNVCYMEKSLAR